MDDDQIARALNEWMRRYTEDPAGFEAEFQTVGEFLREQADGTEPTYGASGAAYMRRLLTELEA